jgi:hypothetical protein
MICKLPTELEGGLAQLARAPALQAGGRRFDSDILHGRIRDWKQVLIERINKKRESRELEEFMRSLLKGILY